MLLYKYLGVFAAILLTLTANYCIIVYDKDVPCKTIFQIKNKERIQCGKKSKENFKNF